jgi:hypothetical protein
LKKNELNQKLDILKENKIITDSAYVITNDTFDLLSEKYGKEDLTDSDMFWTHMCMALTRIEQGESIEGPMEEIVREIRQTPYKSEIEEIITFVKSRFHHEIPKEEQDFFYLHLHQVLDKNK